MFFITAPEKYDVIVTDNLFGDVITDIGAAVAGGIGLAASRQHRRQRHQPVDVRAGARLGPRHRRPAAWPTRRRRILSLAMLLDHQGRERRRCGGRGGRRGRPRASASGSAPAAPPRSVTRSPPTRAASVGDRRHDQRTRSGRPGGRRSSRMTPPDDHAEADEHAAGRRSSARRSWPTPGSDGTSPTTWCSSGGPRARAGTTPSWCRTARSQMDPATNFIHYGQSIFEGLKAYRRADGSIATFRPAGERPTLPAQCRPAGDARAARGACSSPPSRRSCRPTPPGCPTTSRSRCTCARSCSPPRSAWASARPTSTSSCSSPHRPVRTSRAGVKPVTRVAVEGVRACGARRHRRGQVRGQLRGVADRAGAGRRRRAATRWCGSMPSSAAGSRRWAA